MNTNVEIKRVDKRLIASKSVFMAAIVLFVLAILSIWLSGIEFHRSIFKNAIFITSIISSVCFIFFSTALFKGWKLKDDLGKITHKFKWVRLSNLKNLGFDGSGGGGGHFHGFLEGFAETLELIVLGIISILLLVFLLWLFGNLIWAFILFAAGALYWIFFRAVRFVLRRGLKCKGNFWKSIGYGFAYTTLYSFTFYLLILIPHFISKH